MCDLNKLAVEILKSNDRGVHTVPSPRLYPHQWFWDSAFAAIGWSYIDKKRAIAEIKSMFDAQWEDGRVPHIRFDPNSSGYFPGPDFWETENTSSISQPPVTATALRILFENGVDRDEIRELLPIVEKSHLFFYNQRDPQNLGLVAMAHPWESGLDNSPAWDKPMTYVDVSNAPEYRRVDKEVIKDSSQRPSDSEYLRYSTIVKEIANNDFGRGSFLVYDPMFSAILINAEEDLAWLGKELDYETDSLSRARKGKKSLLEKLWIEEKGFFAFYDSINDELNELDLLAAHFPLILDLPESVEKSLRDSVKRYKSTEFMLPTVAPGSELFNPVCYWRGPIWINTNWYLAKVLGEEINECSLELVKKSGFREYYNPNDGSGLGAEEFTWSAALVLDILNR